MRSAAVPATTGVWRGVVQDALWAPSPHNTQPWQVRLLSGREAELWAPADRLLPVEDPDGRFLTAGLGIFLEALDVAASARGLALEFEYLHPPLGLGAQQQALAARLELVERGEPGRFNVDLLARRRTSRLPYDGRPAAAAALRELSALGAEAGHDVRFSSDRSLVDWVVGLNADTVFYDLDEDDRREEIGQWTCGTDAEAARKGDGFSPACLGFSPLLVRLFFRRHGLFHNRAVRTVAHSLYARSLRGTATVGWIAGPWRTSEDWLEAGRMLMRFWLALTAHGLYVQPFGSVITNPRSHARLAERLELSEGDRELWLLLRVGYSAEPPRSARRPLSEVLA
jgi:nitroreductase